MFLNRGFKDFIAGYLKDDMLGLLQDLRMPICESSRQTVLDMAVAGFEIQKRRFNGGDLTIFIRGIKKIPGKGIHDHRIVIPR